MSDDQFSQQDPTKQHAVPGSGEQTVDYPGRTAEMDVRPDHGEHSYRGTGRLLGKKTVITGGDSGIGRAVAIAFAREGADVLITHLDTEKDDADETASWVRQAGTRAVTMAVDLRDEQACGHVVERALAEFGGIDVLVSNAAYQMSQDNGIDGITSEQFDRVMKTNVYALFWLCKAAVPHMPPGSSSLRRPRSRRSSPPLTCSTTQRRRPRSSTSSKALAAIWLSAESGSTQLHPGRSGHR